MSRGVLAGILLALTLALSSGCEDASSRLDAHRTRGDEYLAEEKFPEAIIEYRNVLQLDPNDAVGHYGLARAYLAQRELGKAFWELQESVRLDPSNIEARLQYANFLLFGKEDDLERAVEQTGAILESEPANVNALLVRGRALQELARPEQAQATFEKAVEVAEKKAAPILMLANFHRRQDNRPAAEPLYRRLAEIDPGFVSHSALAGFLAQGGEQEAEAEASYRKALESAEEAQRTVAVQALGGFYYSRERFEDAEQTLRDAVESSPDDLDLIYALARFYHARGDRDRADQTIEQATQRRPDEVKPYLILSGYRSRKGDVAGALEAAEAALGVDPTDKSARLRKAELLVDIGYRESDKNKIAQGSSIVDAILAKRESDPEGLFVRSKIQIAESKFSEAVATLRKTLDARPDWAQAHFLLASALFARGDRPGARAELVRALEADANLSEARRLLAQVHSALGEFDLAIEQARRVLRERPEDIKTRILVAQSLVRQRKLDRALAELNKIPEEKRDAEVHYALGRVYRLQQDLGAARRHITRALQEQPGNVEVLRALLDLDVKAGRVSESLKRAQAAVQAEPENPGVLQFRGLAQMAAGKTREAEESFRQAISLDPSNLRSYEELARLLAGSGRPREMVTTYEQALEARPSSASLNLLVGMLHEGLGLQESAMERYEEAIRLDPELGPAKNNLAYLLTERGDDLDRALDLAQEAKSLLPDNANASDTLGWVLFKKGIPSAAIGYLKEAEGGFPSEDPSLGIVRRHLALAYEANGEVPKAREVVERALQDLAVTRAAIRKRTGKNPEDPPWAAELRSLQRRLTEKDT